MYGERPWPIGSVVRLIDGSQQTHWTLTPDGFHYRDEKHDWLYPYNETMRNWKEFELVSSGSPPVLSDYV
jgi:hypothetical protein